MRRVNTKRMRISIILIKTIKHCEWMSGTALSSVVGHYWFISVWVSLFSLSLFVSISLSLSFSIALHYPAHLKRCGYHWFSNRAMVRWARMRFLLLNRHRLPFKCAFFRFKGNVSHLFSLPFRIHSIQLYNDNDMVTIFIVWWQWELHTHTCTLAHPLCHPRNIYTMKERDLMHTHTRRIVFCAANNNLFIL